MYHSAFFAIDYGNRLPPIPLAVECPIFHVEIYLFVAFARAQQKIRHFFNRFGNCQPVKEVRIDKDSRCDIDECLLFDVAAFNDLDNLKSELFREVPIPCVVSGNRHYSARAVVHHHVVGDEYRQFFAVDGVDCLDTLYSYSGLFLL